MSAAGDRLQDTARKAALVLPHVSHGYPFTPGLDVYKVADKVFRVVTDDPDEQIITVKCEPKHTRALERGSPERRPYEPLLPQAAARSPSQPQMASQFTVLSPQESANLSASVRTNT